MNTCGTWIITLLGKSFDSCFIVLEVSLLLSCALLKLSCTSTIGKVRNYRKCVSNYYRSKQNSLKKRTLLMRYILSG